MQSVDVRDPEARAVFAQREHGGLTGTLEPIAQRLARPAVAQWLQAYNQPASSFDG